MQTPPISFIVPLKNEERLIRRCLESILAEMQEGDELIVVDNGSTDMSLEIVGEFAQVSLFEQPELTIGGLRNFGAQRARGQLLAFIDSDCLLVPGWRHEATKTLSDASIAACGSKYALPTEPHWIEKAWFAQTRKEPGEARYINSGNLVVRKDIYDQIGGFDECLTTGEDAELCFRLRSSGYVVFENPAIQAIHLGNPKNLLGFYRKQRWHGLGMFGTFKISKLDKPLIMTFGFVFCLLVLVGYVMASLFAGQHFSLYIALVVLIAVPTITAFYRCAQYSSFSFFPHFVFLYTLYYAARSEALVRICLQHKKK